MGVALARVLQPAHLLDRGGLPFHLPGEILEDARRRLGFAVIGIGFAILASAVWMALVRLFGWGRCPTIHFIIYGCGVVSAVAIYRLTKSEAVALSTLVTIGLVYEALVAFCTALIEQTTPLGHGQLAGLSWVTVLIVFFPVVVPATPFRTLVASTAAALACLLAGWLVVGSVDVLLLWNNAVAVGLSLLPSLIVSRLGDQLGKAREMGQYVLEEKLGEGGMGEVWRATHRLLSRPAAIKLIQQLPDSQDQDWTGFRKEARLTAELTSPHTVTVYDFGESEDGQFYYAMELLDGVDLKIKVQRDGPLTPDRAVKVLIQVCRSLEEAHSRGLIHRDIKPSNLLLCQVGTVTDFVKVLDFGLAISGDLEQGEATNRPGRLVVQTEAYGTPEYIAPEQARGAPIDGRADLYALGCVGYWLLSGEPVFPGRSRAESLMGHLNEEPPPLAPRIKGTRISSRLEAILASCLNKDPTQRPATAGELREQLSQCPEATWRQPDGYA